VKAQLFDISPVVNVNIMHLWYIRDIWRYLSLFDWLIDWLVGWLIACLAVCTELCPACAAYYGNRSAAYMMLSKYDRALDDARRSTQIDPAFVKVYCHVWSWPWLTLTYLYGK